jgi:hypothetical protein
MQAAERNALAFCKQVMEVAVALRAGLHTRGQVLQLVKAPAIPCDPVDLSWLSLSLDAQVTTSASASANIVDSGVLCDAHHIVL